MSLIYYNPCVYSQAGQDSAAVNQWESFSEPNSEPLSPDPCPHKSAYSQQLGISEHLFLSTLSLLVQSDQWTTKKTSSCIQKDILMSIPQCNFLKSTIPVRSLVIIEPETRWELIYMWSHSVALWECCKCDQFVSLALKNNGSGNDLVFCSTWGLS